MAEGATLVVRGEAIREADPELATFTVTVSARDADRSATLARVTARHDEVRAVLDEYAEAVERRETGAVLIYPEHRRRGEKVAAYNGSISTTVIMSDFAVLGELMLHLGDADRTAVVGPRWSLRSTSEVYREARREAVAEAITRAKEYADALGAEVTSLIELADSGLGGGRQEHFGTFAAVAGGMPRGGAGELQLNLDPERQTVRAQVEARFTISEPTLLG